MSLSGTLKSLGSPREFPAKGRPARRWGQLLRERPDIRSGLDDLQARGKLTRLASIGPVAGGVVTRANAFFVVREIPFEKVPQRFGITARDYRRVAVIEDGLKTLHRIERVCLRPIIKGPDALVRPVGVSVSDLRLFDCQNRSKETMRKQRANGALAYIKRGETVAYNVSEDTLKGGIPAQRSNIRLRKPYWYSLYSPVSSRPRIVVPEHFDERFPATLLEAGNDAVVLDKLFTVTPEDDDAALITLIALHTTLSWYQYEQRGRTQLGEGVLELKRADWDGVLVANPACLSSAQRKELRESFQPLQGRVTTSVDEMLADPDHIALDLAYLEALGFNDPEGIRVDLERELRSAMAERKERAASVADAKASRTTVKRVATNIDAYASRIAAALEAFPDPRNFVPKGAGERLILISGPVEGELHIGEDLLTQGQVLSGDACVAATGDLVSAQLVRSVLLHDPEATTVHVPDGAVALAETMKAWEEAGGKWRTEFETMHKRVSGGIADERMKAQVRARALSLLHAG